MGRGRKQAELRSILIHCDGMRQCALATDALTGICHARDAQALKRLLAVEKHFGDFVEDQFDFHSYCVRKMTLRAYVQMLRMEDRLHHSLLFAKVGFRE